MENFQEQISADELLASMSLESAWPAGMNLEAASQRLLAGMAARNKEIVGDLQAAYFEKIEEAVQAGQELTREQREFFDEETASRQFNPLYQKPKPF